MKRETRERIRLYEEHLPAMKEKVAGAVLLLVMAITMMVSVTFAWITLSANPEATSIDTTVIANGNLEIALSPEDGSAPGKSASGDSFAAKGSSLTKANVTWGNLVNLSDKAYGLEKITLRPAALNGTSGLLTNPLYGVAYGEDGRVSEMTTENDFAYVYYDEDKGALMVDENSNHYGVRAVSTVKYENLQGDNILAEMVSSVDKAINAAKTNYSSMTDETQEPGMYYIKSIEGLMQIYAQNQIDGKAYSTLEVTDYVSDLYEMMVYLRDSVFVPAGQGYLAMADMCEFIESGNEQCSYDIDSLCTAAKANKLPDYMSIPSLKQYATDRGNLANYTLKGEAENFSDLTDAQKKNSLAYWAYVANTGGKVYWSDISAIINWVCTISSCEVDGIPMSSLRSNAMNILRGDNPHAAVIKEGVLARMEQRIGAKMSPTVTITVDASSIISLMRDPIALDAVVTTPAEEPYEMQSDRDAIKKSSGGNFKGTDATAEDTYALSVDLWVRTNAGSKSTENTISNSTDADGNAVTTIVSPETSFLTLEGHVVTSEQTVEATMKDLSGNEQLAYVATVTVENQDPVTVDVFERYGNYYIISTEVNEETGEETKSEVKLEEYIASQYSGEYTVEYTPKMETKTVVVGYEGENRVWTDDQMIAYEGEGISTTQGSGSCYTFYAETPADQARFLELLNAMRVVFVNGNGRQIGMATMDTENYYAENGKVTVPLVLVKSLATNLGTDSQGNTIYGLTELEKNVATRITALVYLDGTKLSNDMVLASGDIQGSLNIQFGSSNVTKVETTTVSATDGTESKSTTYTQGTANLAIKDSPLMDDYIEATASVTTDYFEFDPNNLPTTTLNVAIAGTEPSSVSARFIRAVSSTQGSLQESIVLNGSGGKWSADCTFTKPGTYILRTVWIDGVEYDLNQEEPVKVTVEGSSVTSLTCDAIKDKDTNKATIMTAENEFSTSLTLGFSTSLAMPKNVNGVFMDEQGRQVSVAFDSDETGTIWTGTATFASSGTYTMEYVEVDGELYLLGESLQPTLEILLGLKVRTWITCSDETLAKLQEINPAATATNFTLVEPVSLLVSAEVYDNNGNELVGLSDVKLIYGKDGSQRDEIDSNMTWDNTNGRYVGMFPVEIAGSYNFKTMEVGSNIISKYTNAPGILALPAEDAYYYDDYTLAYQYAPNQDAAMTIGVAYSSAVAKMEATVTRGTESDTVEGVRGYEEATEDGTSVNRWSFTLPQLNGTQEGEWTLESITMYGVYYEDQFYSSDGPGVTIDLSGEAIKTSVVNYIHVTLNGNNGEFTNYFAEANTVDDMTVAISDYKGDPIQYYEGDTLKPMIAEEVSVKYYLNYSDVSMDTYGYTADGLESVTVSGSGSTPDASNTVYAISDLNFRYAGEYKTTDITFKLGGTTYNAKSDTSFVKLAYKDHNGSQLATNPVYKVYWTSPTITITGVSPTGTFTTNFGGNSDTIEVDVENYYENYYARLYGKFNGTIANLAGSGYTAPKVTLKLTNAGNQISDTNFVNFVLTISASAGTSNTFTFKANNASVSGNVGSVTNNVGASGSMYTSVNDTVDTILMNYGGIECEVKLSDEVTIKSPKSLNPSMSFVIPSEYSHMFTAPASINSTDGRPFTVKFDKLTYTEPVAVVAADTTVKYKYTETRRKIAWSVTTGSGCDAVTTDYEGYEVVTVKDTVETGYFEDVNRTYATTKWTVATTTHTGSTSSKTHNAGSSVTYSANTNVATATVTYTDSAPIGEPYESSGVTATETTTVYYEGDIAAGVIIEKPSNLSYKDDGNTRTWEE